MFKKLLLTGCALLAGMAASFSQSFGPDVILHDSLPIDQRDVKITAAFNGWLFSAHTTVNTATDAGGIMIRRSVDGGYSWQTIDQYSVPGVRYTSFDLVATGNDLASLRVFLSGVLYTVSSETYTIFIDQYNGETGVFQGSTFNQPKGIDRVYDVEIASDYRFPAVGTAPYSVALLYSCFGSISDSIISVLSLDGGATFPIRNTVQTTNAFFGKVSLDYGRSNSASNGRYFAAWERKTGQNVRNGNIFTARHVSQVNGPWTTPVNLDSLSTPMTGVCRNPRVAVQQSDTDNDSASVTMLVLVDRDFGGTGTDYDVLGFYNKRAHFTDYWFRFDVANYGTNDHSGDLVYENVNQQFHGVYLDSTNHALAYVTNTVNLTEPDSWSQVETAFNDSPASTAAAQPRIAFRPVADEAAIVWIDERTNGNGVAKIDVESFVSAGVSEQTEISALLYPNPVKDQLYLEIDGVYTQQTTELTVCDLNGRIVEKRNITGLTTIALSVNHLGAGSYLVKISSAYGFASKLFLKE